MPSLPPGTILQLMYLKERLTKIPIGRFIEIGPGSGDITAILLEMGWQGTCCDFNSETTNNLKTRFDSYVEAGKLSVLNEDFLQIQESDELYDLVISCMVMEHQNENEQSLFLQSAKNKLKKYGRMIAFVPASPDHWGIEDKIAGHYRRYTRETLKTILNSSGWKMNHQCGLTFPVSNILLPISNFLVTRSEGHKESLTMRERTSLSGNRNVRFKTNFPAFTRLILNEFVMMPFHIIQKSFSNSKSALVLYFEATPKHG